MTQRLATVTLIVRDYDEAIVWYTRALGFALAEDTDLGNGKRWVVLKPLADAGARLLLARAVGPEQAARVGDQTGGRVAFFLETSDFAARHAAMVRAGVVFTENPRHEPYGIVAVFRDLYGNLWDLIEPQGR